MVKTSLICLQAEFILQYLFTDVTKSCSSPKDFDKRCLLKYHDIEELIHRSMDIIQEQPMLLELDPPVTICGR